MRSRLSPQKNHGKHGSMENNGDEARFSDAVRLHTDVILI